MDLDYILVCWFRNGLSIEHFDTLQDAICASKKYEREQDGLGTSFIQSRIIHGVVLM